MEISTKQQVIDITKLKEPELTILENARNKIEEMRREVVFNGSHEFFKALPLKDGNQCVYFIEIQTPNGLSFVKIGKAIDVKKRLNSMQSGNPFQMIAAYYFAVKEDVVFNVEGLLHAKFRHLRYRGEWFWCQKEILDWILEHIEANKKVIMFYPRIEKGDAFG